MHLKPYAFLSTVAAAATSEQLTTSNIRVPAVVITAERSNTGYVYVGDKEVSSTRYGVDLSAGDSIRMSAVDYGWANAELSLKDVWLDVSVSGDGVSVMYLKREE